jgi:hypothetical protein
VSAALMDAPVAAAIGDLMVVRATPAIGRIDLTAMAIGLTVMGIAGAIKQEQGSVFPRPKGRPRIPWICRSIYDPSEWEIEEEKAISRMKNDALDRLVAAGRIKEIDRERVRFIVRRIVQPRVRPD